MNKVKISVQIIMLFFILWACSSNKKPIESTANSIENDSVFMKNNKPYSDIKHSINSLFKAMHLGDTLEFNKILHEKIKFYSLVTNDQEQRIIETSRDDFYSIVTQMKQINYQWDEVLEDYNIQYDGSFAHVWTPYTFYLNDTISHCGINNFLLIKQGEVWVIHSIWDTRRTPCN